MGNHLKYLDLKESAMKKWFLILWVLWVVCSCKSKQKFTTEFREEENRMEQVEAFENERVKRDSSGQKEQEVISHREDNLETETVVKVTEYDTSKPVVEGTGRPPVVRETETATKQRKGVREGTTKHIRESGTVGQVQEKQLVVAGKSEMQQELDGKMEQKKVRKNGSALWNWIGLAGVVAVLGYIYVRKWR